LAANVRGQGRSYTRLLRISLPVPSGIVVGKQVRCIRYRGPPEWKEGIHLRSHPQYDSDPYIETLVVEPRDSWKKKLKTVS